VRIGSKPVSKGSSNASKPVKIDSKIKTEDKSQPPQVETIPRANVRPHANSASKDAKNVVWHSSKPVKIDESSGSREISKADKCKSQPPVETIPRANVRPHANSASREISKADKCKSQPPVETIPRANVRPHANSGSREISKADKCKSQPPVETIPRANVRPHANSASKDAKNVVWHSSKPVKIDESSGSREISKADKCKSQPPVETIPRANVRPHANSASKDAKNVVWHSSKPVKIDESSGSREISKADKCKSQPPVETKQISRRDLTKCR